MSLARASGSYHQRERVSVAVCIANTPGSPRTWLLVPKVSGGGGGPCRTIDPSRLFYSPPITGVN